MSAEVETHDYDVLIIGAGGAGLRAAIAAREEGMHTAIICKSLFGKAHTVMAEGGIAASMGNANPNDNWQVHFRDTMRGGKFLNNWRMAELHAKEAPDRVWELETYGADDSRLPMSGMASYTPGMEMSGGSLGQGLTIAVGMALGLRRKRNAAFVYNSMSDGELDEGATWEAAMSASHFRLSNLITLVDVNNQQADGHSGKTLGFEPLADKWAAFGWHVQRVDGNAIDKVRDAFDIARGIDTPQTKGAQFPRDDQPRAILFDTKMGKGVPFLEAREKNHFMSVEPAEWRAALAIIEDSKA